MPPDYRVYIVDDDEAMRNSLDFLLTANGFAATTFETGARFLEALPEVEFGCVVTDVRMPDIDGISLLRQLKSRRGDLPVVVMTGHGDVPLAVEAMKLGAADFLEKPFEADRLIAVVRTALERGASEAQAAASVARLEERVATLSRRERQVLEGLVSGLSNKAIGQKYDISPRTVEVYRANVMTKMLANNLSELVRAAIRAGLHRD